MTTEFLERCKVLFSRADADGNGTLDADEFKAVLESDSLKLNLPPDELAQIIDNTDKDGDGISLAEFIPVVQALFFRHRAQKAACRKKLPVLKRSRCRSALERTMKQRPISGRATPVRAQSVAGTRASPAQRRWGMVRTQVQKGAAERALAMPEYIDQLDFATITKLIVGARKATETDVWNLRRQASEAVRAGNLTKAETLYKIAVKVAENLTRKQGQVLLGLTALADIQIRLEKYHYAIQTLERSLQIRKSAIITDKAAILHCLVELSLCSMALRKVDDGVSYGLQGYEHYQLTNARIMCTTARWKEFLLKLAEALTIKGRYKKAMEVQEQAASVLLKQVDKSSKEASHVLTSLGFVSQVAQGSGLSRLEAEYCERVPLPSSADPTKQSEIERDLTHATTMYSLGRHLLQQKQAGEAGPLIQQALTTFTKVFGRKHPRVGFALTTLASCYALEGSQKKLRRALNLLERSAAVLTSSLGPNNRALAEGGGPLPVQAQIEEMLGQLQAARRTWHTVAAIRMTHAGSRDPGYLDAAAQKERVSQLITTKKLKPASTVATLLKLHQERVELRSTLCIVCGLKSPTRTCQACTNAQKLQKLSRYRYMQDGTNHPRLWSRYLTQLEALAPVET
ncbi:hypothetical protein PTSG_08083 [Salpingoeca rosetta]|uniref:EF-hand domain-containing protein n=1 Tax=Salpingoeca rosetta (strain ATCC 50818 / BSB-021) TaxID=946362 RepID=F2UHY3_SALR5|nr:uncharacterized protein PTSG_08083 [Salpingoeca rosetta]EGD76732.1 hypothetical protein PTSG_08083 [Salpingoeca rosetta]|eukprot:XP_004991104.1 hypothetical protein PTSG_08083 [Salpingoeca rosetta]